MPYSKKNNRYVDKTIGMADKYLSRKHQWMLMPVVLAMGAAMMGAPNYVMPIVIGVMAVVFLVDKYILSRKTTGSNGQSGPVHSGNFDGTHVRRQVGSDPALRTRSGGASPAEKVSGVNTGLDP